MVSFQYRRRDYERRGSLIPRGRIADLRSRTATAMPSARRAFRSAYPCRLVHKRKQHVASRGVGVVNAGDELANVAVDRIGDAAQAVSIDPVGRQRNEQVLDLVHRCLPPLAFPYPCFTGGLTFPC